MSSWDDSYERGRRLHRRIGRAAEAGEAFRHAISLGDPRAQLALAAVLVGIPGRQGEEEAALREALGSNDPEVSALAALRLGNFLWYLCGDPDAARVYFDLAYARGTGKTALDAMMGRAHLDASQGDRVSARDGLLRCMEAHEVTLSAHAMSAVTAVATGPLRGVWYRYRRALYRSRRRLGAIKRASRPARWAGRIGNALGRDHENLDASREPGMPSRM